jgi:hypothetical protein
VLVPVTVVVVVGVPVVDVVEVVAVGHGAVAAIGAVGVGVVLVDGTSGMKWDYQAFLDDLDQLLAASSPPIRVAQASANRASQSCQRGLSRSTTDRAAGP